MNAIHLRAIVVVAVLSVLMGIGWYAYQDFLTQGQRPALGTRVLNELEVKGLPEVEFKDTKGKVHRFADFKGQIVLLNFWASWCEPCIHEFPSMLKLIDHFKGRVKLLAVSADYEEADLTAFLKAFKAINNPNLIVVWDKERKISKQFGTESLPETFIIGPKGEIVRKIAGSENWSGPDPIAFFASLLEKK